MSEPCRRYVTPVDVHKRLDQLGLRKEHIDRAVQRGLLARMECTPNDPVTAAGFEFWKWIVRSLRDELLPVGWKKDNAKNQGLVVNPHNSVTIAVVQGDHNTGRAGCTPSTRSARGPATEQAVQSNSYFLFHELEEDQIAALANSRRDFWILLIYLNEEGGRIQFELSRPVAMSEGRRPVFWSERVLFDDFTYSDPTASTNGNPALTERTPEIVVEVKRRA